MINGTKWGIWMSKIGQTVYRLIKQIGHVPTRIVCDLPDGRWIMIIAPNVHEYHIYIGDKEEIVDGAK